MLVSFQDTFNPSQEVKRMKMLGLIEMIHKLISMKHCCTCIHSETRECYMHSYKTSETFCKKRNESCITFDTCDDYEVDGRKFLNEDFYN